MSEAISDTQLITLRDARVKRAKVLEALDDDELRPYVLERGWRDPVFWIEKFCSTYDPRLTAFGLSPWVPFRLYPKQREFVRWVHERYTSGESGVVPKCRGVGASWVLMAYLAWLFCTSPDTSITVGSRTEASVDDGGNMDALMPKISGIIDRLPDVARATYAPGWDAGTHHTHRKIMHPSNGSMITGEVGKNMGRGGRSAIYVFDEAAHHDQALRVDRAISMNTNCLIEPSTPNGSSGTFARKVKTGALPCFYLRHDTVPHHDAAWLDRMKNEKYGHDPVGFAQEILVDFEGSDESRAIAAEWGQAALDEYLPRSSYADDMITIGADVSTTGADGTIAVIRRGPKVLKVIDRQGDSGHVIARWLLSLAAEYGAGVIAWDAIGVGEGVSSVLRIEAPPDLILIPVIVSRRPTLTRWDGAGKTARQLFSNLRAELYWTLRERFRRTADKVGPPSGWISLPEDTPDDLLTQLGWIRRANAAGGKIAIERKKDLKKRTGRSPDLADAMMIAYASDVLSPARLLDVHQPQAAQTAVKRPTRQKTRRMTRGW